MVVDRYQDRCSGCFIMGTTARSDGLSGWTDAAVVS